MVNWPFSKTRTVKYPGGVRKTVFKDIKHVFPLAVENQEKAITAGIEALDKAKATIDQRYAITIHDLLYSLSDLNQSLMLNFRGAYAVYLSDPLKYDDYLARRVERLGDEQHKLTSLKMKIDLLLTLAQTHAPEENFYKVVQSILDQLDGKAIAAGASQAIDESKELADSWIGEG